MAAYFTYPCKVKLDSIIYDFELNEGGYAVLKSKIRSDTLVMKSYMANVEFKMLGSYATWDIPTQAQKDSVKNLVEFLKAEYNLSNDDVYEHDDISPQKVRGEAKELYEKE